MLNPERRLPNVEFPTTNSTFLMRILRRGIPAPNRFERVELCVLRPGFLKLKDQVLIGAESASIFRRRGHRAHGKRSKGTRLFYFAHFVSWREAMIDLSHREAECTEINPEFHMEKIERIFMNRVVLLPVAKEEVIN